jgi:hypothetical protein
VGTLHINGGETLTKNPVLQLALSASDTGSGIASMSISETPVPAAAWQSHVPNITYTLQDTAAGNKTIYVWYRDKAGNISATVSAGIELTDSGGSGGVVKINNDAEYTNTRNVTLTFSNNHGLAYEMRVSDGTTSKWVSKNTTLGWTLAASDGTKSVSVEYRNQVGNVMWSGTGDTIILDTASPGGSVTVLDSKFDNGQTIVGDSNVKLRFNFYDVLKDNYASGVEKILLELNNGIVTDIAGAHKTTSDTAGTFDLSLNGQTGFNGSPGGINGVTVNFIDYAGNQKTVTLSFMVVQGGLVSADGSTVKIDNGDIYTNTVNVKLSLKSANAVSMNVSNSTTPGGWITYAEHNNNYAWTIASGDGLKTVYVQYRDALGNVVTVTDDIYLDTTAPAGTLKINGGGITTDAKVLSLQLTGSNDTVSMNINEANIWRDWQSYLTQSDYTLLDTATGNKTVYVWLRDRAGNISATISASIILGDATGSIMPEAVVPAAAAPLGKKIYAYPNPARPRQEDVTIVYGTDKDGMVNIYLYKLLGEKIWSASGYARVSEKNKVIWLGRDAYGAEVGNGVYILLLVNEQKKVLARGRLTVLDD